MVSLEEQLLLNSFEKVFMGAAGSSSTPHLLVSNVADGYLAFYDISGGAPDFLSSFTSSDFSVATEMQYDSARSYLYVLSHGTNKILTIDISDPSNPSQSASYSTGKSHDFANGLLYISSSQSLLAASRDLVSALDISNPANVSSLSTLNVSLPGYGNESSIVYNSGTYAWLHENSLIRTLNVSNLNSISSAATKVDTTNLGGAPQPRSPMFLDAANNILLTMVYDPAGISTWNISNPTSVSKIASSGIYYPRSVDFSLVDRIAVTVSDSQIKVFSISTSGGITSLGTHTDSSRVDGNRGVIYNPNTEYVHVFKRVNTSESNIHTYDVSSPSSISFVSTKNIYSDVSQTMVNVFCNRSFDIANL
jgi:hypothetical protein